MAKPAFGLDGLDLLGVDNLLFISDNAGDHPDPHAHDGRDNGLDVADLSADEAAAGLEIAETAPDSAPGIPGGPPSPGFDLGKTAAGNGVGNAIALLDPQLMGGKGGTKGPSPSDPTDPTDPPPDPSVLDKYTSMVTGSGFNIEILFKGSEWTSALQQSFIDAANLISSIITGDIADVFFRGKIIDDIRIDASLVNIDGSGGILGQAGPTAYRTSGYLPATAVMQFDIADAEVYDSVGLFNDIVFHEMMHSIGFGTMWDLMALVADVDGKLTFTGVNATDVYGVAVPIEDDTGFGGTDGGHWNEMTWAVDADGSLLLDENGDPYLVKEEGGFNNEIMTGFIDDVNYLSLMTIAALEDMGYETVYGDANSPPLDTSIFTDTVFPAETLLS